MLFFAAIEASAGVRRRNLSECVVVIELTTPGPCPAAHDAAGNPWQLWLDDEPRCPIGALGFAVQDPDTLDIVPVYDAMVPQRELYRLCPWTEED